MRPSETARIQGVWKAVFICPNGQIQKDLVPLLTRLFQQLSAFELNASPSRAQPLAAFGAESPNLCFIEVGANLDAGFKLLSEVHRIDPKLPIVAVLGENHASLVMQCL